MSVKKDRKNNPRGLDGPSAIGIDTSKVEALIRADDIGWGGKRSERNYAQGCMRWMWSPPRAMLPGNGMGPHACIRIQIPPRRFVEAERIHSLLAHELVHAVGVRLGTLDCEGADEERVAELGAEILCRAFDWPYPDWIDNSGWETPDMLEVKRRIEYIVERLEPLTQAFGVCEIQKWTWPQEVLDAEPAGV